MIKNIFNLFKCKSEDEVLSNKIRKIHSLIPQDFGGGCSQEKALIMSLVITKFKLNYTADIGVYRGRSLFPQAIAHQKYSGGIVYGIDPFKNEDAVQNDRPDLQKELDNFILTTDFQKLYDDVSKIIADYNFQKNCVLVRKKSSEAVIEFKQSNTKFGLIHVDGNHDTKFVMEDIDNYFPLLAEKSFIVLDDISWDSVKPAYTLLNNKMKFIDHYIDSTNDFALFGKGITNEEINELKNIFNSVKNKIQ